MGTVVAIGLLKVELKAESEDIIKGLKLSGSLVISCKAYEPLKHPVC